MLDYLFNLIIYPIQILINVAFINIANIFDANCGMAIIGVSFVVSLLCLPMYDKAHKIQEEENELQKRMELKIKSIKKNFKGDEKHMLISAYYRENKYSPFMALRNSLSLFIQIPFFIAAYLFFSHLPALQEQSFLFLKNLALQDGLLHIGGHVFNLMPILMTAINIIAGEVYTKGHTKRERIQIYGVGLIFLVLLYNSPSGLVLYWTCNNIFSLFKNISYRMKKPIYLLYCVLWIMLIETMFFISINQVMTLKKYIAFGISVFILSIAPFLLKKFGTRVSNFLQDVMEDNSTSTILLLLLGLANCVLLGGVIPFNLVSASPFEFSYMGNFTTPLGVLVYPICQALGIFVFWPLCLCKMFSVKVKNALIFILGGILFVSILNIYIFNVKYGTLSPTLILENPSVIANTFNPLRETTGVLADIFGIIIFSIFIFYKKLKQINNALIVFIISGLIFTVYNGVQIQKGFLEYQKIKIKTPEKEGKLEPFVNFTKNGKNVVVFMFDRAISAFLPIIFEKRPDLKEEFEGFTYYPNAVSYSCHTITASAPLFGGYEYTPEMQNLKSDRLMVDKQNEATFTLPKLFMKNGWSATMSDIPLVNYKWVSDPSVFIEQGIKYENLVGKYSKKYKFEKAYKEVIDDGKILVHNLLFYSFMNAATIKQRAIVYQDGKYWDALFYDKAVQSNTKIGLDNFSALYYLPDITIADSSKNSFFLMQNELPHVDFNLQYPEFVPKVNITNLGENFFEDDKTYMRYQTNMAMIIQISRWLKKMKELGVYNNTRIIFVSDHGIKVNIPTYDKFMNEHITPYNPVMLIKDFGKKGEIKIDKKFMTNADVPYYATLGLFEQINTVTNKKLTTKPKEDGVNILLDFKRLPGEYRGTNCIDEKSKMWHVKDDITKESNWSNVKPSELQLIKAKEGQNLKRTTAETKFNIQKK